MAFTRHFECRCMNRCSFWRAGSSFWMEEVLSMEGMRVPTARPAYLVAFEELIQHHVRKPGADAIPCPHTCFVEQLLRI